MTGIICVNKEQGMTSFDVVARLRGICGERKIGHTGTLDPMATGVLPVLLGGATRFLDYLPQHDKRYRAAFRLGMTTDTLDITGTVLSKSAVAVKQADVEACLSCFRGVIRQIPPMYSAVSVNGKRLYDLARQGIETERPSRTVTVHRLQLMGTEGENIYVIDVTCSKGTYIRTLIDDIGKALGCGAVMTALQRTEACGFGLADAYTLEELQARKDAEADFSDVLTAPEKVFEPYEAVTVTAAQAKRFSNGGALDGDRLRENIEEKLYRIYGPDGVFLGLGEGSCKTNELLVKRLLVKRD